MVCEGGSEAAEVSAHTARKWVARYRAEGAAGLLDRSSAPLFVANRSDEHTVEAIAALRRLRFTGPEISEVSAAGLDGLGDPDEDRDGSLGPARPGAR